MANEEKKVNGTEEDNKVNETGSSIVIEEKPSVLRTVLKYVGIGAGMVASGLLGWVLRGRRGDDEDSNEADNKD